MYWKNARKTADLKGEYLDQLQQILIECVLMICIRERTKISNQLKLDWDRCNHPTIVYDAKNFCRNQSSCFQVTLKSTLTGNNTISIGKLSLNFSTTSDLNGNVYLKQWASHKYQVTTMSSSLYCFLLMFSAIMPSNLGEHVLLTYYLW